MSNLNCVMKNYLLALILILFTSTLFAQRTFDFTDVRDEQIYKAIEFEIPLEGGVSIKRVFLAENMNYKTEDSFCYKNVPVYCEKYGRLYTEKSAMEACPDGWRLATRDEWFYLISTYGGINEAGKELQEGGRSGFNLLLAGYGYSGGKFNKIGQEGVYWDIPEEGASPHGVMIVDRDQKHVHYGAHENKYANSVRCIRE